MFRFAEGGTFSIGNELSQLGEVFVVKGKIEALMLSREGPVIELPFSIGSLGMLVKALVVEGENQALMSFKEGPVIELLLVRFVEGAATEWEVLSSFLALDFIIF